MICGLFILTLEVLALIVSQSDGYPEDYPSPSFTVPVPVKAVVISYNPIECDKCRGGNAGQPNIFCGTDGQNYYNFDRLTCINQCKGTNVQFAYSGQCRKNYDFKESKIASEAQTLPAPFPAVPVPPPAALPLLMGSLPARPPSTVALVPVPPMSVPPASALAIPFPPSVTSGCPCMRNIGKDEPKPFCADDGYTYHSESEASCISSCYGIPITKIHDGRCVITQSCNCQPSFVSDPICGSDGNTYMNRQALDCSNYCYKQRVQQTFKGKCGGVVYSAN